jgi:hypothetical protein
MKEVVFVLAGRGAAADGAGDEGSDADGDQHSWQVIAPVNQMSQQIMHVEYGHIRSCNYQEPVSLCMNPTFSRAVQVPVMPGEAGPSSQILAEEGTRSFRADEWRESCVVRKREALGAKMERRFDSCRG